MATSNTMCSILKFFVAAFVLAGFLTTIGFAQEEAAEPTAVARRPLVMAHYMPWYSSDRSKNSYGWHWTMDHFDPTKQEDGLPQLASKFHPLLGAYDSGDAAVIECHLLMMKLAGIDGVVVDWYGLADHFDYAMLHRNTKRLVARLAHFGMKLIICYEDQTVPKLVRAGLVGPSETVSHVAGEVRWLSDHWFGKEFYVKFEGDPVFLSFGSSGLSNQQWSQCMESLDFPVCYVSEHTRGDCAAGAFDWPIPDQGLQAATRFLKESQGMKIHIPVVFPRFDDVYKTAGVNAGYKKIDEDEGRTFARTLKQAMSSKAPIVQIATWNDWGEGTQIEPSHESGFRDLIHLQKKYPNAFVTANAIAAADFQIALQIYQLRKQNTIPREKLSNVVDAILNSDFQSARAQLAALGSETKSPKP